MMRFSSELAVTVEKVAGTTAVPEGGSDPEKLLGGLAAKKWGSIKGRCQEKTLPLPQGEERFSDIELPPKIAR